MNSKNKLFIMVFLLFVSICSAISDDRGDFSFKKDFLLFSESKPNIYFDHDLEFLGKFRDKNVFRISVKENRNNSLYVENAISLEHYRDESFKKILYLCSDQYAEIIESYKIVHEINGFDVEIRTQADYGTSSSDIKEYLANFAEENFLPHFIVIIGNTSDIPQINNSDYDYGLLSGEDQIFDSFVSRISINDESELAQILSKNNSYRNEVDTNWIQKALLTASSQNSTNDQNLQNSIIENYFNPNDFDVVTLFNGEDQTTNYQNEINSGLSLLLFQGLGQENAWIDGPFLTSSVVSNFNNSNFPFVGSFSDFTGSFSDNSMRTKFMNQENGAVGFFGTNLNLNEAFHRTMEENFIANISNENGMIGSVLHSSLLGIIEEFGVNTTSLNAIRSYQFSGDPTLMLRTGEQSLNNFSIPSQIDDSVSELSFVAENYKNGWATIYKNNELISRNRISTSGGINLDLTYLIETGDILTLYLNAQNQLPYSQDIEVISSIAGIAEFSEITLLNDSGEIATSLVPEAPYFVRYIIKNIGLTEIPEVNLSLAGSIDSFVSLNNSITIENLDLNQSTQIVLEFRVEASDYDEVDLISSLEFNGNTVINAMTLPIINVPIQLLSQDEFQIRLNNNSYTERYLTVQNEGNASLNAEFFVTRNSQRNTEGYETEFTTYNSEIELGWFDISSTGAMISLTDNGQSEEVELPFTFPYFDDPESNIFINANGIISFEQLNTPTPTNGRIPSITAPNGILAPFWDDLKPIGGDWGSVYYQAFPEHVIVQFEKVNHAGELSLHKETFQIILRDNGNIEYLYKDISNIANATIGYEDQSGVYGEEISFEMASIEDLTKVTIIRPATWLTLDVENAEIPQNDEFFLTLQINTDNLSAGTYTKYIRINSNDNENPEIFIPVHLSVEINGDFQPPQIVHNQLGNTSEISARTIIAEVTDNNLVDSVSLFWKHSHMHYEDIPMTANGNEFTAEIPAQIDHGREISYYIKAIDNFTNENQTRTYKYEIELPNVENLTTIMNDDNIQINWNNVSGAEFYKIYVRTSLTDEYQYLGSTTHNNYSYNINFAADRASHIFKFKVIAVSID